MARSSALAVLCLCTALLCTTSVAQDAFADPACDTTTNSMAAKYPLPAGAVLEITTTPDEVEFKCTAVVRRNGAVLFDTSGFGVRYAKALSGRDLNGDGAPDIVIGTDEGGGAHCCWTFSIVSLGRKSGVLATLPNLARIKTPGDKPPQLWTALSLGGFDGLSEADSPSAWLVYRITGSKTEDITASVCDEALADVKRSSSGEPNPLSPKAIARFKTTDGRPRGPDWTLVQTKSAIVSLVLQDVLCGRFDQARQQLVDSWPASDIARITDALIAAVPPAHHPERLRDAPQGDPVESH